MCVYVYVYVHVYIYIYIVTSHSVLLKNGNVSAKIVEKFKDRFNLQ